MTIPKYTDLNRVFEDPMLPETIKIAGNTHRTRELFAAITKPVTINLLTHKAKNPILKPTPEEIDWIKSASIEDIMKKYNRTMTSARNLKKYLLGKFP